MNVPSGYMLLALPLLVELVGEEKVRALQDACTFPVAPMPKIPDRRLAYLEFQVAHSGHTPERAESMLKGGVDASKLPHGITVAITTTELAALLAAYRSFHG